MYPSLGEYAEKKKRKMNVYSQVGKRFVETLVDIRISYPDAVEDLLQSIGDKLPDKERRAVETAESSEVLGHLFGMKLAFWVSNAVGKSPNIRIKFADAIAVAAKCKNLGSWIEQLLRTAGNLITGEETLKVISVDEEQ